MRSCGCAPRSRTWPTWWPRTRTACALEPRQRAIVDLALTLAQRPAELREADLQAARDAGLTQDEIWDVGSITALFAASNRLAHLFGLRPNDEFFTMGR